MRSILLSVAFASAYFLSTICVGANELPKKFDPQRDAAGDLSAAIRIASESGRNILLDVGGDWCSWCEIMERWLHENPDIANFLHANYVLLKVNLSKENSNEEFLSQFGKFDGVPHFFVLSSEGKLLHSQNTAFLEMGKSYDKKKFLAFLKEWSPKNLRDK